jgi:hypothetical protein
LVVLVALIVVAVASGKFDDFIDAFGLGFVLIGGFAVALMSFSVDDVVTATKGAGGAIQSAAEQHRSAFFWESVARNFWMVGVLATLIAFAVALTGSPGEIGDIFTRMAGSLVSSVYGLLFFVTCLVVSLKLSAGSLESSQEIQEESLGPSPSIEWSNGVGYLLFIAMVVGTLVRAAITGDVETNVAGYHAWEWLVYWPSLLVVLGGTTALVLYIGNGAKGRAFTFGFAVTGFIGSLMGLIQVLLGMAAKSIQEVSFGVTLILSSCFFALLGMVLVGAPLEDLDVKNSQSGRRSTMSRVAWYVFPLVTMIFVVITLVIVITPMEQPA